MQALYDIIVAGYRTGITAISPFNAKASRWTKGRKNLFSDLEKKLAKHEGKKLAWFHCASLGEFEQGRPVIEAFRAAQPGWTILLTFFSPSGYEIRKNYEGSDIISYLPLDTRKNARKFIEITRPSFAVFVKYEFWFNFLEELNRKDIPFVFASAIFRPEQHFFKSYGTWARKKLGYADRFFVQDERSKRLLESKEIKQVTVAGDTRFDRVMALADRARDYPVAESFRDGKKLLLAGSTWPADEELLAGLIHSMPEDLKIIIAPHEISGSHLSTLGRKLGEISHILLSVSTVENVKGARVLIVDSIGHLMHLYRYCDIAYIGGGFGAGIHNILEAATFGKPVIFGPKYHKFKEARDLTALGGAFPIEDAKGMLEIAGKLLSDSKKYREATQTCKDYVQQNTGATGMILSHLLGFTGRS